MNDGSLILFANELRNLAREIETYGRANVRTLSRKDTHERWAKALRVHADQVDGGTSATRLAADGPE